MMRLPAVHVPGAGVGGRRGEAHGRSRARGHAGGRRDRSLPEHEAAPVRAHGAGRAARRPGPGRRAAAGRRRRSPSARGPRSPRSRAHPEVRARYPALATAAGAVSTPQLRNMGTLGGNVCVDTRCNYYNQSYEWRKAVNFCMKKDGEICLVAPGSPRCWAVSSSDTAPVLWSLGASVRLAGPAGERTIPISALYQDDGIQYLTKQPGEIVTEIVLPPADGARSVYLKLRRRGSFDFPVLGVAVALHMDGDIVRQARIVLGAVASLPREAPEAARAPGRRAPHARADRPRGRCRVPARQAARQHRPDAPLPEEDDAGLRGARAAAAGRPAGRGGRMTALGQRIKRLSRRAGAAAAPARREGRPHPEHAVADRVGAADARRCPRWASWPPPWACPSARSSSRRPTGRLLREPEGRLPGGVLRRLHGEVARAGRRALPG